MNIGVGGWIDGVGAHTTCRSPLIPPVALRFRAGVRIYEYEPTMFHAKVMIVDGLWVSVGSTNFDDRSFRLNDEANVNVIYAEFGAAQAREFTDDQARAHEVTLQGWRRRPLKERLQERGARLLAPQL
jgi:cardiolipin synthase